MEEIERLKSEVLKYDKVVTNITNQFWILPLVFLIISGYYFLFSWFSSMFSYSCNWVL